MSKTVFQMRSIVYSFLVLMLALFAACGSNPESESEAETETDKPRSSEKQRTSSDPNESNPVQRIVSNGPTIEIKENSPADTVRVFYERLREKRIRDAILLTNLRPAVEGLTDDDLKDLGADFTFMAQRIPEKMPINGEIVSGKSASVTVKMPNAETNQLEVREIRLRKENKNWTILVADRAGERMARKEGKNYFFALRMDVHHEEARAMLDRIGKAQMIYSMKNGGKFTDLRTLIGKGYVPQDAQSSASTGYSYDVKLATTRATYTALATPAVYGKTGKLSFALRITRYKQPALVSKDLRGKTFKN